MDKGELRPSQGQRLPRDCHPQQSPEGQEDHPSNASEGVYLACWLTSISLASQDFLPLSFLPPVSSFRWSLPGPDQAPLQSLCLLPGQQKDPGPGSLGLPGGALGGFGGAKPLVGSARVLGLLGARCGLDGSAPHAQVAAGGRRGKGGQQRKSKPAR